MATDFRTGLLVPGFGTPLPQGDAQAIQVPIPSTDCADSPWNKHAENASYGDPTLDTVVQALERIRQRVLEPLLTAEQFPPNPVGVCCRVWLGGGTDLIRRPIV